MSKFNRKLITCFSAAIVLALGSGLAMAMYRGVQQLPITNYFDQKIISSVWDWQAPIGQSSAEIQDNADFLRLHQINTVFLNLDDQDHAITNQTDTTNLSQNLTNYIKIMQSRGIKVYGAAGSPDWSQLQNQAKPVSFLDFAHNYNEQHPSTMLAGFEFDVESYNQPEFLSASTTDRDPILVSYLDLTNRLISNQQQYLSSHPSTKFGLGFTVPYWYDDENNNIEPITWQGQTNPVAFLLLDQLNQLPNSNIDVMAYRNAALGNDGAVAHAQTEVLYASARSSNVKVIIGQETGNVQPSKVTYYGSSWAEMAQEIQKINTAFYQSSGFGGFAIDDLSSLRSLVGH